MTKVWKSVGFVGDDALYRQLCTLTSDPYLQELVLSQPVHCRRHDELGHYTLVIVQSDYLAFLPSLSAPLLILHDVSQTLSDLAFVENSYCLPLPALSLLSFEFALSYLAQQANQQTVKAASGRLLSRKEFVRQTNQTVKGREVLPCAVACLDFSPHKKGLSAVNHTFSELMAHKVAERLLLSRTSISTIAHIQDDQIGFLLRSTDITQIRRTELEIRSLFTTPLDIEGHSVQIVGGLGIALFPQHAFDAETLLSNAAMAAQQACNSNTLAFELYYAKMQLDASDRLKLEQHLRSALRRNELVLYYQPRIDLKTRKIVSMEGLLRWRHPDKGLLPPKQFIPIAEESGLIIPIGYWTISQALQDLARMGALGHVEPHVSINMSFAQFHDPLFAQTIIRNIQQHHIEPNKLELEVTETELLYNEEEIIEGMQRLRSFGLRFSLDDFGTGYSSFTHIRELPISTLKVDRSFVTNMAAKHPDFTDKAIVHTMIRLAHDLDLEVVAEGVESLEELELLERWGCDQVQGYLFSQPVPFEEVVKLLALETLSPTRNQ